MPKFEDFFNINPGIIFGIYTVSRLIAKLKAYGFDGLVIKGIEAFLKDRRQRIVQGEIVSEWDEILSRVIQGSCSSCS